MWSKENCLIRFQFYWEKIVSIERASPKYFHLTALKCHCALSFLKLCHICANFKPSLKPQMVKKKSPLQLPNIEKNGVTINWNKYNM